MDTVENKGSLNPTRFAVFVLFLFVLLLTLSLPNQRPVHSIANVAIYPPFVAAGQGQDFVVNITISSVSRLYGWEIKLNWTSSYLDAISVSEGSFLKSAGNTFFTNRINNTEGHLIVDCTLLGMVPGVTGGGVLISVVFNVKTAGQCLLDLYDVSLLDDSIDPQSIPCESSDGYWSSVVIGHDIAVTDVKPSKSVIGQGFCAFVNVTVRNFGGHSETFNTTTFANDTVIHTDSVTLARGSNTILTFLWNATVLKGNYTLSAYAWPVPNETDTMNNNFTSPLMVMIGIPGDVVSPFGVVDMKDIAYVAKRFGTIPSAPLWDPIADFDSSGKVDMKDIAVVARNFGMHDP